MKTFEQIIDSNAAAIRKVVDFNPTKDELLLLDFTSNNKGLTDEILDNTALFSDFIDEKLQAQGARYGIGGYDEHRTIYSRSNHFDTEKEPRRLHLGVDIWGPIGTPVYNFYDARVHSFANNNNFGDYGATIILSYEIGGFTFHALYGHLSAASLQDLEPGQLISAGSKFAEFGQKEENGFWPPHLHFQIITDMGTYKGDFPGVCSIQDQEYYLFVCPDPDLILRVTSCE